ncbi:hypothetical protein BB561_001937 [Smittium simulii]|uniref:Uncharacterized protein n=1 Tax=Smittium simulii TaxID=133385 RepID=A0A2T9YSK4_9FUNG|nr:hypothetical protein BB561_001937 [Smittium simulii]
MSEGHSVLFDQDNFYQNQISAEAPTQNVEDLDFYQTTYSGSFTGQQYSNQPEFNQPSFNQSFADASFSQSTPAVEISWLSAFGTGGLPNEPPLLEGFALYTFL